MRFQKFYQGALLLAASLCFLLSTPGRVSAQEGQVVDEIVAVVGDQLILRSDVDGLVLNVMRQQQEPYSEELWQEALQQLINQKVMAVVAQRDTTIKITDEQVQQALDQRIRQLVRQVGSEQKLEELYGKSLAQVRVELREEFRSQMMGEQLQQQRLGNVKITPSEVREWFSQFPVDSLPPIPELVRVSHIVRFPKLTEEAKAEAREILTTIRDSIVTGGGSFEELARQFSDDPGSAANGGHYESMRLGDLVSEFAAVASRITPGEVSQVFESPFGYHILRVNERRGDVIDFHQILIEIDDSKIDPTETIAYLNMLRDSILVSGVPFELIAKRHSEEESTAPIGGRVVDPRSGERDLVLAALGRDWQRTIDTLEVGEVSMPAEVELLNGRTAYHIVLLQRRIPEHQWSIETDYERIEQYALQEKRARLQREWLDQLRKQVYIDLRGKARELAMASGTE